MSEHRFQHGDHVRIVRWAGNPIKNIIGRDQPHMHGLPCDPTAAPRQQRAALPPRSSRRHTGPGPREPDCRRSGIMAAPFHLSVVRSPAGLYDELAALPRGCAPLCTNPSPHRACRGGPLRVSDRRLSPALLRPGSWGAHRAPPRAGLASGLTHETRSAPKSRLARSSWSGLFHGRNSPRRRYTSSHKGALAIRSNSSTWQSSSSAQVQPIGRPR
jgi:hypothetical protein